LSQFKWRITQQDYPYQALLEDRAGRVVAEVSQRGVGQWSLMPYLAYIGGGYWNCFFSRSEAKAAVVKHLRDNPPPGGEGSSRPTPQSSGSGESTVVARVQKDDNNQPIITVPGIPRYEDPDGRFLVVETEPVAGQKSEKKPFLIMEPSGKRLARAADLDGAIKKGAQVVAA